MSQGRKSRGPVAPIKGLRRIEGAHAVPRVSALERVAAPTRVDAPARRSFSEALERAARGLHSAEPLPSQPSRPRSPPPPRRDLDEDEPLLPPEPPPDSFLGLLWWKVKGRR